MPAQLDGHKARHRDRPHLLGLRGRQHELVADPLRLPIDRDRPAVERDPVGGHAPHLTDPQAREPKRHAGAEPQRDRRQDRQGLRPGRHLVRADHPITHVFAEFRSHEDARSSKSCTSARETAGSRGAIRHARTGQA
jgi:hypothetical protein